MTSNVVSNPFQLSRDPSLFAIFSAAQDLARNRGRVISDLTTGCATLDSTSAPTFIGDDIIISLSVRVGGVHNLSLFPDRDNAVAKASTLLTSLSSSLSNGYGFAEPALVDRVVITSGTAVMVYIRLVTKLL